MKLSRVKGVSDLSLTHGPGDVYISSCDEMTLPAPHLARTVAITKALAHPARLRILAMLRDGDLCVCQIAAVLELAASTVSAHLAELRRNDLLTERKKGKWVHYALTSEPPLTRLIGDLLAAIEDDPRVRQDRQLVLALRQVPTEVLCRAGLDLEAVGVRPVTVRGDS